MKKIVPGALAGCLASAVLASPAVAGPTVTVRVEGAGATLLERTRVTLPDTPPPVAACPRWTAAAALEEGTAGNWDRAPFTQTILGEAHTYSAMDFWAEWVDRGDGYKQGQGVCNDVLADGDELLMLVDQPPFTEGSTAEVPLDLEGVPAAVQAGQAITVAVVGYRQSPTTLGNEVRTPVAGATVSGGGVSAVTGADGTASLTFTQTGAVTLKATKAGSVVSAGEPLTVSAVPVSGTGTPPAAPPPAAKDTTAPEPAFAGLASGTRYARGRGPRRLRGSVAADPSGLRDVKLSISRRRGDVCSYFSGRSERFKRQQCGRSVFFRIGADADWSYLLPRRLGRGRYVITVSAIDRAFNRANERVVIRVR